MITPPLSDSTFQQLAEFIQERTGIHIPAAKKYLIENRLYKVLEEHNLNSYDEYLYMLKYGAGAAEIERLFDAITTNETYFFREPVQYDVIIESLLPKVLQSKSGDKTVRIWSAACSSGEEAYTLSLMLREKRPDVKAEIIGSDISRKVLGSAERGIYSSYSVRNVPKPYMMKYFTVNGQDYQLDKSILKGVRFKEHNLLSGRRGADLNSFDIVLCRNVLIYFENKTKQTVVSNLYDSLRHGGFLVIGSSESLHNVTRAFKPVTINKVVLYEKA